MTVVALASTLFTGCAKDDPQPDTEEPVATQGSFSWTLSSGQTTTADSAHCYGSITTIYAFKNGNATTVEAALSSLSEGSYSISAATGNSFVYSNGSVTQNAVAGQLTISANAQNKVSGTFNLTLSGGPATSISGSFSDIPKR